MTESKLAYAAVVAKTINDTGTPAVSIARPAWVGDKQFNQVVAEGVNHCPKKLEKVPTSSKQDIVAVTDESGSSGDKLSLNESSPTPAETAEKEKMQQKHRNVGGGANNKTKSAEEKPEQSDKKGEWKKLDVGLSFNKKKGCLSGEASRSDAQGKKKTGGRKNEGEKRIEDTKKPGKGKQRNAGVHAGRPRDGFKAAEGAEKGRSSNKSKKNRPPRGKKQSQAKMYQDCQPLSPADFEMLKAGVVGQVEYFFSDDELSRNIFLRRHMDIEGYIPAAIIFNFPSVAAYCFPYYDLLGAISEKSNRIEVDEANDTLRLKVGYAKWLCPNEEGGHGCAKWIKQQVQQEEDESTTVAVTSDEALTLNKGDILGDNGEKVTSGRSDDSSNGTIVTPETASCTDSESVCADNR